MTLKQAAATHAHPMVVCLQLMQNGEAMKTMLYYAMPVAIGPEGDYHVRTLSSSCA